MISYVLKLLLLTSFSFLTIFFYYQNPAHIENFDGYFPYIFVVGSIYLAYKMFQVFLSKDDEVSFTPWSILLWFLLHLGVLSGFFFVYNDASFFTGIVLFFKILLHLLLPLIIVFLSLGVGSKLFLYIAHSKKESLVFQFLVSLGIGCSVLFTLIAILGVLGIYNVYTILLVFGIGFLWSWRHVAYYLNGCFTYRISFEGHKEQGSMIERIAPRLLSTEFLFIVITFILSVNLINISRPFPIGWDDLGAYMNIPHLFSTAGSFLSFGGFFGWQSLTGIGYLFGSATQAFFINNIGGVLSAIVLVLVTKSLLDIEGKEKKTYINIPLLIATIFTSLPMIIFQQAKDMKLDTGVFFISTIAIYILVYMYAKHERPSKHDLCTQGIYVGIVGALCGLAFALKLTGILLILGVFAILFFVHTGVSGFLGFLGLFIALFTHFDFWSKMNVQINDPNFQQSTIYVSIIVAFISLLVAYRKYQHNFLPLFQKIGVLLIGIILVLLPWFGKNIYQTGGEIAISSLLSGASEQYKVDYTRIYTDEELEKIEQSLATQQLTNFGTTTHEDYGRYLGYEAGINNHLKLPLNLSMQTNQGSEFTDISYIFLALIPVLLLFLPYRNRWYKLGVVGVLLFELLFFLFPPTSQWITALFSQVLFPGGYVYILFLFLSWLLLIFMLKDSPLMRVFKMLLVCIIIYTFLWTISSFGVVWYGIVMYFGFLLFIAIGLYYISIPEDKKELSKWLRLWGSSLVLLIVSVYFFLSTFPHGFNNLKNASYTEFKTGKVLAVEAPFLYHPDYLDILFWVNIDDTKKRDFINEQVSSVIAQRVQGFEKMSIAQVVQVLKEINGREEPEIQSLKSDAKESLIRLYNGILHPKDEYKNTVGIYRIGTFLSYYIDGHQVRYFSDSLLNKFQEYFYDPQDVDIGVERLHKMGLRYLLVDLNAATIDRDPEHRLTARYENLLRTFTSEKLTLIRSDSLCLELALDLYRSSQKTEQDMMDYLMLAGANHESYFDGKEINRGVKQVGCYQKMIHLINEGKVSDQSFSYLKGVQAYLTNPDNASQFQSEQDVLNFFRQYVKPGFKVLFKIEE